LKIAILGSGPIPNRLGQELDAPSVVELFTSQKVRVDGIKVSDYRSLLNMTPDFEVVVLAWRGIPKAGTEKAEVLKHIVREATPDALIINLSSVSVYGQNSETNFEATTPRPINPYGYSKYYLERYLNIFATSKVCNLRISNVFGHPDFDDILNRMLLSAENSVSIKIFSPDDVTRDFISINTLTCNLKDLLLVSHNLGRREIFNISSENTIKLTQLKNLVEELLHKSIFYIEESGTAELILNSSVSNKKIRSVLNAYEKSELVELSNYIQKVTSKNN
jgi:nucleoside-diphosphate-sugar epimerase